MKRVFSCASAVFVIALFVACNQPGFRPAEERLHREVVDKGSTIVDIEPKDKTGAAPPRMSNAERDRRIAELRKMEREMLARDREIEESAKAARKNSGGLLDELADEHRKEAKALFKKAEDLIAVSNFEGAFDAFDKSAKLWPANPDAARRAAEFRKEGEDLFKKEKYKEAAIRFKIAVALDRAGSRAARDRLYECLMKASTEKPADKENNDGQNEE